MKAIPMRGLGFFLVVVVAATWLAPSTMHGETLVLSSDRVVDGTIIQTNGNDLVLLTDYGIFKFGTAGIKAIQASQPELSVVENTNRLPNFRTAILSLSRRKWATDLTQIPATVIEKGVFRNVPYVSLKCGEDYELNIYGDLLNPAAIEIGLYRKLLTDEQAKANCLDFVNDVLAERRDRSILLALSREKDLKVRNGLTFEFTPPTDEDAYQGWWISVYSEERLNRGRASEKEMAEISLSTKAAVRNDGPTGDAPWSAEDLKLARPAQPVTISFHDSAGDLVENAEVVRVEDNAYVIWRKGSSGGKLRLANLNDDLQKQLGYDPDKAAKSYAVEGQRQAELAQERAQASQSASLTQPASVGSYSGKNASSSSAGRVYVHGYSKANGTYVQAYTRRAR